MAKASQNSPDRENFAAVKKSIKELLAMYQFSKQPSSFSPSNNHSSLFRSRPFSQENRSVSPKPEDLEFSRDKNEVFQLQLKAEYGTITPVQQERLTHLQAKIKNTFLNKLQRVERYGYSLDKIKFGVSPKFSLPSTKAGVQAKLSVGQPNDKYEQEADRVASEVVDRINSPNSVQREEQQDEEIQTKLEITALQTQADLEEQQDEDATLQGKSILQRVEATEDLESTIDNARGSGQSLDPNLQKTMGQAMGADFSSVKVHTDTTADQLNRSVQARAFTTGQDLFFRQGEYNPGSKDGQELIAHELTHVVQQNAGSVRRAQLTGISYPTKKSSQLKTKKQPITTTKRTFDLPIQLVSDPKKGVNQSEMQKTMVKICRLFFSHYMTNVDKNNLEDWYKQINLNGLCGAWATIHKADPIRLELLWNALADWHPDTKSENEDEQASLPNTDEVYQQIQNLNSYLLNRTDQQYKIDHVISLIKTAWQLMAKLEPDSGYEQVPGEETDTEYTNSLSWAIGPKTRDGKIDNVLDKGEKKCAKELQDILTKKVGKKNKNFIAWLEGEQHHASIRVEVKKKGKDLSIVVNEPELFGIVECGDNLELASELLIKGILSVDEKNAKEILIYFSEQK
ncbi:MAG: DUF4157 domain-containing protein [Prochloraceae cyanobacterium]